MNVLITDGESRSALAVTRSLGKKGCRVIVTSPEERSLASTSKFCRLGIRVPDPLHDGNNYVKAISEIAAKEAIEFIFPMTDQSINQLNQGQGRLPITTVLACPPAEVMQAVFDKARLFHIAENLCVPIPKTLYLANEGELSANIEKIEHYPIVVKPAFSKIPDGEGFLPTGVRYASSRDELKYLYATSRVLRYPSMIQERIVGPGTGLFTLYCTDRHLALFSHRRLREKPPSGGVSVVCESVPLDEEMVEAAGRLLSAVGWDGVAMVEFKRDQRDGRAKLMEINGRFWGSLQLAITCGIDFPTLLLDHLQGIDPPTILSNYQVGHKLKWFFGTLDHLLIRLKSNRDELDILLDAPSRLKSIIDFMRVKEKNTSFDVFDCNDRGPFWLEARLYIRQVLRSRGWSGK